jgi:cell division protein FtsB
MRLAIKIAMGVLVLLGAMYLFAFPARTYLAQKRDIAVQARTISVLKVENTKLAAERTDLQNDTYIEQLARREFGLVMPGQQAFMVLPTATAPARHVVAKPKPSPWYSHLEFWHHI